ncbi:MAG: DUF4160 domain-containing protein [Caldilineales bacterium]|nr:DUF4160 domain-containing protein [Caldilineales bacterium]
MPTISMFYGIIIRMYYAPGEHNPPHFHAYYNDYTATIALDTLETLEGELPRKQLRLVQAWAELRIDELWGDWKLAMNGETLYKIAPLQ